MFCKLFEINSELVGSIVMPKVVGFGSRDGVSL